MGDARQTGQVYPENSDQIAIASARTIRLENTICRTDGIPAPATADQCLPYVVPTSYVCPKRGLRYAPASAPSEHSHGARTTYPGFFLRSESRPPSSYNLHLHVL